MLNQSANTKIVRIPNLHSLQCFKSALLAAYRRFDLFHFNLSDSTGYQAIVERFAEKLELTCPHDEQIARLTESLRKRGERLIEGILEYAITRKPSIFLFDVYGYCDNNQAIPQVQLNLIENVLDRIKVSEAFADKNRLSYGAVLHPRQHWIMAVNSLDNLLFGQSQLVKARIGRLLIERLAEEKAEIIAL